MDDEREKFVAGMKKVSNFLNIIAISPSNMNIDVYPSHFKIFPSCVNRMFWATHRGHDGQTAKQHSYPGRCRVEKQFCNILYTGLKEDLLEMVLDILAGFKGNLPIYQYQQGSQGLRALGSDLNSQEVLLHLPRRRWRRSLSHIIAAYLWLLEGSTVSVLST